MKTHIKIIIIVLIASISLLLVSSTKASAVTQDSAPYQTFTEGPDGFILTQTAYEPTGSLVTETNLLAPEDMYIKDQFIYVADTGNKRVLKFDFHGKLILEIKDFKKPTGIHVDANNNIYVADQEAKTVNKYDEHGNLLIKITRPEVPLFGNAPFEPTKLVSGPRDILYIAGVGSTSGLIQLNGRSEFLGFFGTNPTKTSLWQKISSFFGVNYARTIPVSVENLAIDEKGSVFTVSKTEDKKIKKFNISSTISLSIENDNTPIAIKINEFGNIYTVSEQGIINEYDSYGNLIFQFGVKDDGNQILGKFVNPVDIDLDQDNNIYVLDKGANAIQILVKSEFAGMVHDGLINYRNGVYNIEEWAEVLRMNSFFNLANVSIANALYRDDQFGLALDYFKIANDKAGYSEAFWQVRYNWMQDYLATTLLIVALVFVLAKSLKFVDKKYHIYDPIRNTNSKIKGIKVVKQSSFLLKILKHPVDTIYELKKNKGSNVLVATLIYLLLGVLTLISMYTTGFIFNNSVVENFGALKESAILVGAILLFVVANYLISSLQSGEGWFKDIYINVAYALAPLILSIIPLMVLSHVLTINELFIYTAIKSAAWVWTIVLMILVIKEVHNYTFKQLVVNLLLTVFTMLMIVLIGFLIYVLSTQLFDYIGGIIKEVILRV